MVKPEIQISHKAMEVSSAIFCMSSCSNQSKYRISFSVMFYPFIYNVEKWSNTL